MKKKMLAIVFAAALVVSMLPAGLAVSAAADENLLVNGSFEIAAEEGSTEFTTTGAKGWFQKQRALGVRAVYDKNVEGAVAPVADTGDAYFVVTKDRTSSYNDYLYQSFKLVAGKKYTASYLTKVNRYAIDAGIKFNSTAPTTANDVVLAGNMGDTAANVATDWRRVSATFVVPGEAGTEIDAVFTFSKYNNTTLDAAADPDGYIDDVRVVEAQNDETVIYTVNGFENYANAAWSTRNGYSVPVVAFSGESGGYNGENTSMEYAVNRMPSYSTLYCHRHEDGNTVFRFNTHARGVSYIKFALSAIDFAGKGVTVGTPIHLSFKARLVDIPDGLNTSATPTFGIYTMQGTFKEGLMEPYEVGSDTNAPALTDAEGNSPAVGSIVYLKYPALTSYGMKDLALSTKNVNEQDPNANEWVQYDFIFPYQDNLTHLAFYAGYTGVRFTGNVGAGYSWEMDDLELTLADTGVLPNGGTLAAEHTYKMLNNSSEALKVKKAYANADGTGTEYTFASAWQTALKTEFPFPCYTTQLDAKKNVKSYAKTDTAAGTTYIAAEDAAGASVVTAVYKTDGAASTLVGVNVDNAAAGFVAAPEVALSAITAEAGTYEVRTYILALSSGTLKPVGNPATVEIK